LVIQIGKGGIDWERTLKPQTQKLRKKFPSSKTKEKRIKLSEYSKEVG